MFEGDNMHFQGKDLRFCCTGPAEVLDGMARDEKNENPFYLCDDTFALYQQAYFMYYYDAYSTSRRLDDTGGVNGWKNTYTGFFNGTNCTNTTNHSNCTNA